MLPSPFSSRQIPSRRRLVRSLLELLESRIAPATASYAGGVVTFHGLSASANDVSISFPAADSVQFVLGTGDTFTSAPVGADFTLSQTTSPNDTLTITHAHSVIQHLDVTLGSASDILSLDLTNGVANTLPTNEIQFNAGTGSDQFLISGSTAQGSVTHTIVDATGGSVDFSGLWKFGYTGVEQLSDSAPSTDLVFNLPGVANTAMLGDNGAALTQLSGATIPTVAFANPSNSLTIKTGTATDTLTVNALPNLDTNLIFGTSVAPFHGLTLAGAVSFTGTHGLTVFSDQGVSGGGALTLGSLSVTAGGDLTLTGTVQVTGQTTLDATNSHNIALIDASNHFGTVGITAAATARLVAGTGFTVSGSNTATLLLIESSGAVDQTGAFTGTGGLELASGTLTLSKQNSYSGQTEVDAGTLVLASATPHDLIAATSALHLHTGATLKVGSTGTGALTLASGQTLSGAGTVMAAMVTAANGSGVIVGDSSSNTLNFTGDLTFQAGSLATFRVDSAHGIGHVAVDSDIILGGANLVFTGASNHTPHTELILIQNNGADPLSGTFAAMPEGTPVQIGSFYYHLTYHGGSGDDLALEPGAGISLPGSSVSYLDEDGDTVKITATHGTLTAANLHLTAANLGNHLTSLDLSDGAFLGADITIAVSKKGPKGNNMVNVGKIDAGINDLGIVTVAGDLGQILAGSGAGVAVGKLAVTTFGANGSSPGTSALAGNLGVFTVAKDFSGGELLIHGNISMATIGGTLGGNIGGGGELVADGAIASVTVGKDLSGLAGGAGLISAGSLGDVMIKGSVIGGAAAFGAGITSSGGINSITIGGDLRGGSAGDTTSIGVLGGDLNSLTIKGSFLGGTGATHQYNGDGHVYVSGNLGLVVVGKNYTGGSGVGSAQIISNGSLAGLSVGGTYFGGSASDSGKIVANQSVGPISIKKSYDGGSGGSSGQIISSNASIQSITVGGSYTGGAGSGAGSVTGQSLGSFTVGGFFLGGSGASSGQFNFQGTIGTIAINGNFTGASGMGTSDGAFHATGGFNSIYIRGNFTGGSASSGLFTGGVLGSLTIGGNFNAGQGSGSGQFAMQGDIGSITIGGSFTGGPDQNGGLITTQKNIGSVTIGKSFSGGGGSTSGGIIASGSLGSLTIKGDYHGGSGDHSAEISATGMGPIFIGGNFDGGSGQNSGSFYANTNGISSFTVKGSFNGGSGSFSGNIVGGPVNGAFSIGKNYAGGSGSNSGAFDLGDTVGSITIGGNFDGGSGSKSGNVNIHKSVGLVSIRGNFTGGSGDQSGQINVKPEIGLGDLKDLGLGSFVLGGNFVGGTKDQSGQIDATTLGVVTIGGNFTGGSNTSAGRIKSEVGGIASIAIKGSLMGGSASGAGEILSAADIGQVTIGKNLVGGSASGMNVVNHAGAIVAAGSIRLVQINGSIMGGTNDTVTASSLTASGAIQAGVSLGTVSVTGSITGTTSKTSHLTSAVVISATGPSTAAHATDVAINTLTVGGSVSNLEVLAGYGTDLVAHNGSAQIGTVSVKKDWTASNLVAGVVGSGSDGMTFGDSNDTPAGLASRIANVIIGGKVLGTPAATSGTDHFGFVASDFGSFTLGGVAIALPTAASPFVQLSPTTGNVAIHRVS